MGSCIQNKSKVHVEKTTSLSEIDDSLPLKHKLISMIMKIGTLIHKFQRKISFGINNKEINVVIENKLIELMLNHKLEELQEIIKELKKISGRIGKNFCTTKLENVEHKFREIEIWINSFEKNEILNESDKKIVLGLRSFETTKKWFNLHGIKL